MNDDRQTFYHRVNRDIAKVSDDWLFMVHSCTKKKKKKVLYSIFLLAGDSCNDHVTSLAVVRPTIDVILVVMLLSGIDTSAMAWNRVLAFTVFPV